MQYTVQTVGPVKQITSKKTGKLLTIYQVKFNENENWLDVFSDQPPTIGQTFEGSISQDQYGYKFNKERSGFPMRSGGQSNRQIALQAAARLATSPEEALTAAERFLAWLDATPAPVAESQNADQPPASNYADLGL